MATKEKKERRLIDKELHKIIVIEISEIFRKYDLRDAEVTLIVDTLQEICRRADDDKWREAYQQEKVGKMIELMKRNGKDKTSNYVG